MEILRLETARLATNLLVHGAPSGLPMLFLHGSFATKRWWEPLFALLPGEFRAVAPDLRGAPGVTSTDDSRDPYAGYEVAEQALDVAALVDALGWRGFDLVAHASAAAPAIEYVLSAPEAARSLTLISPASIEGVATPLDGLMLLNRLRENNELLEQALRALMPESAAASPAFFALLAEDAARQAPAAFTGHAEALGRWNRLEESRRLTLPTQLIWGDADPVIGRDAMTQMLVAIPGAASLEVLRGVGHAAMLEAPLLLAEKIVGFVAEDFEEAADIRRRGAGGSDAPVEGAPS